jgi:hypothetical protein
LEMSTLMHTATRAADSLHSANDPRVEAPVWTGVEKWKNQRLGL